MYFVYVIENLKKNLYIGLTDDVENRLKEHQRGETYTTRRLGGPWRLIYLEGCLNKTDAQKRERFLKRGHGREYLKDRLKYYFKTNS
jgi:putative endonuclease